MQTNGLCLSPSGFDSARKVLRILELITDAQSDLQPLLLRIRADVEGATVSVSAPTTQRPRLRLVK